LSKASAAVLCLSHELNDKNDLSIDSVNRLKASSALYDSYDCEYFITTGWKYKKDLQSPLSTIMAEYAIKNFNINKTSIYEEPLAKDTVGEAYFVKRNFFQANLDINKLIVVTSDWHLKRAKEIFQFIFSEIDDPKLYFHEVPGDIAYQKKEASNSSIYAFREMTKFCKKGNLDDIYSKILQHHHLYND
jgi:uncharacterized SAM-binding protein YcdF (DUF218 family)